MFMKADIFVKGKRVASRPLRMGISKYYREFIYLLTPVQIERELSMQISVYCM